MSANFKVSTDGTQAIIGESVRKDSIEASLASQIEAQPNFILTSNMFCKVSEPTLLTPENYLWPSENNYL